MGAMVINSGGLGITVDLGIFDYAAGIQTPYDSTVDVFTDIGSLFHVALGAGAAFVGGPVALGFTSAFAGYEAAKLTSGESPQRIAGVLIEFGIGALLWALYVWSMRG